MWTKSWTLKTILDDIDAQTCEPVQSDQIGPLLKPRLNIPFVGNRVTHSHGISKAKTALYASALFSCQRMVAPIRQRCVIAWVRRTERSPSSPSVSLHVTQLNTGQGSTGAPPPDSCFSWHSALVCVRVFICSFHAHFLFIDFFVSLFVYLSSVHYTIIATIALWSKSRRRLFSSQSTYRPMRKISDTYWANCDGLLTQ